mgnify:CR=1 FL=1
MYLCRMVTVIYKIENIVNSKCYIGSSNNYSRRKKRHFENLKQNVHHSIKLQRAYNKYGSANFRIYELESFNFISKEKTLEREQYYIDIIKPEYNICMVAGSQLGLKRSDVFKKKCSDRMKGCIAWNKGLKTGKQKENTIIKRSKSLKGSKRTEQQRINISKSKIGISLSDLHKKKLSESKLNGTSNNKPIMSYNELGVSVEYLGVGHASRLSGVPIQSIYDSLNKKNKKWSWKKNQKLTWMWKSEIS